MFQRLCLLLWLLTANTAAFGQDARLLVSVADDFNSPLSGVRIQVVLEQSGAVVRSATTDALGTAAISVSPFEKYLVHAALAGYESFGPVHAQPPPGDVPVTFRLLVSEPMPALEDGGPRQVVPRGIVLGHVLSLDGEPVGDVAVEAHSGYSIVGTARTAGDGSFRLSLPPGTYRIRSPGLRSAPPQLRSAPSFVAYDEGEVDASVVVASRRSTGPVEIRLQPHHHFNVTVTVTAGGLPVVNAEVEYSYQRDAGVKLLARGVFPTQTDGTVQLGPLPPGPVTIVARFGRGASRLAGITTIDVADAARDDVTVDLLPAARVSGRVEFLGRSAPLHNPGGGLRILAQVPNSPKPSSSADDANGLVSPDGDFELIGLAGDMCLEVMGIPAGWRLLDISHEGRDITGRTLPFAAGHDTAGVLVRIERGDALFAPERDCSR